MTKFECNVLNGKYCRNTKSICCYYCEYLPECLKRWNGKPQDIFCKIEKRSKWCSRVFHFCKEHGLPEFKEKIIFT